MTAPIRQAILPGKESIGMTVLMALAEMRRADEAAIAAGTPGITLMEAAGKAVADALLARFPLARRVLVLTGPGQNGGDGFVAARHLAEAGRDVLLACLVAPSALRGDSARAAAMWPGPVVRLAEADPFEHDAIVDALFGAGLNRPIEGEAADILARAAASDRPIVAVDVPSGVEGDTGQVLGTAAPAVLTVTFARAKPGHVLLPGRALAGELIVADIGITDEIIARIGPKTYWNAPDLWLEKLPVPTIAGHKYTRGHALVVSGPELATGASRLAARAALRIGAGLVTIAGARDALRVHAAHVTAIMLAEAGGAAALGRLLDGEPRFGAVILGPAAGREVGTRAKAIEVLERGRALVLDADGLSVFAGETAGLGNLIRASAGPVVVTPHGGEFRRLFEGVPEVLDAPSKLTRARAAAERLGAVVVLKGPDTVIAAPDGRAAIADNAPPTLATAGSGDVLAGFVGGLLAQGAPAFEAACAAVWIHGEVAASFGRGLIAEDLPDRVPAVLARLSGPIR